MKFSITVPSFNQVKFLEETLKSVISEEGPKLEIIVKDGGSTDGSLDIIKKYAAKLSYSSGIDQGQTDAINQGLKASTGDILGFLNSDDLYLPGTLAFVEAYFKANPKCMILYGKADHCDEGGAFIEHYPTLAWDYKKLLDTCYICQPSVFWRKEIHEELGFFDERLHYAMDYEFWLRVGKKLPLHYLGDESPILAHSRLHAEGKTLNKRVPAHREILHVVSQYASEPKETYTWLRYTASLTVIKEGTPPSSDPIKQGMFIHAYVTTVKVMADEFGIELDSGFHEELKALLKPFLNHV